MLWGAQCDGLELRSEGGEIRLRARFPYGVETLLGEAMGRERREMIASRAFADRIESGEDIHLLIGHDFNRPLASRAAGSLTLLETDTALTIDARIGADMAQAPYVRDFIAGHSSGLVRGLSPGFRVRPGGERVEERGNGVLRTITRAELLELSAVTKPAYGAAQIEARNWQTDSPAAKRDTHRLATFRWR